MYLYATSLQATSNINAVTAIGLVCTTRSYYCYLLKYTPQEATTVDAVSTVDTSSLYYSYCYYCCLLTPQVTTVV